MALGRKPSGAYDAAFPITLTDGSVAYAEGRVSVDANGNPVASGASGAQPSASSQSVTPSTDTAPFPVVGNISSGAADSGGPVKIGGRADSAVPAAAASGQRVNAWYGLNGQIAAMLVDGGGSQLAYGTASADGGTANRITMPVYAYGVVYNPTTTAWDRARGDSTGSWVHNPTTTASPALSGTIAASGATSAIIMTNTTRTEVINPSTGTLWASWGTPAVNSAGSFPITAGSSYSPPDRAAGTLTLLSTAANQPYTVNRFS